MAEAAVLRKPVAPLLVPLIYVGVDNVISSFTVKLTYVSTSYKEISHWFTLAFVAS